MHQVVYYLFIIVLSFLIGFPIILCSKNDIENWIPYSFEIGTAVLILGSFWISCISKKGLRPWAWIFIAIILIVGVGFMFLKRRKAVEYIKKITLSDIVCLALCVAAGFLPMTIYIIFGAEYPYIDGYTYICNADYFMDSGYKVLVDVSQTVTHPWLSQTYIYQVNSFRIGSQMLLALMSCLFDLKFSIEMFLPLVSFGVMLCGMGSWLVVSDKYAVNRYTKIIAVIIVCFNIPVIIWNAMYGFLPQTMGSALFLAGLGGYLNWKEQRDRIWNTIVMALLIGSFALTYNEMLPFYVLVVFCIMVWKLFKEKNMRKQLLIDTLLIAALAMITIIAYFPGMVKAILSQFGAAVGWNQEKDIFTYVAYFLSTVPADYSFRINAFGAEMLFVQIITLVLFTCCVIGFVKLKRDIKVDFLLVCTPYVIMLCYFVLFSDNPFIGGKANTWSIFKLMQYWFIAFAPFIGICFSRFFEKRKILLVLFAIAFIAYNGRNGIVYANTLAGNMENYVGKADNSLEEYYRLYDYYGSSEQSIALYNVPDKHRQMITYFLRDVDLLSDWSTDVYFSSIPSTEVDYDENSISLVYDVNEYDIVAGMSEKKCSLKFGEGFYDEECSGDSTWRWGQKEAVIEISYFSNDINEVELKFEISANCPSNEEATVSIYTDKGVLLQNIGVNGNTKKEVTLELNRDIEKLVFVYNGNLYSGEEGDTRELAFMFSNYEIGLNQTGK